MADTCASVLRGYEPYDADRGITEPARDVPCTLPADHRGFHLGTDGMPFGPWRAESDGGAS